MARSEKRTDIFGNEYIQHYDDEGREIGRSEKLTGIFGDEYTEHRDERGREIGRSEERTGIFGDEYTEHRDERGREIGRSEERTGIFGDEYTEHRDERGKTIGRSERRTGIFGDEYTEHKIDQGSRARSPTRPRQRPAFNTEEEGFWPFFWAGIALTIAVIGAVIFALWKYRYVRAPFFLFLAVMIQFGVFASLMTSGVHFLIAAVAAAALSAPLYRFCFSTLRWRAESGARINAWQASGILAAVTLMANAFIGFERPNFVMEAASAIQNPASPAQDPEGAVQGGALDASTSMSTATATDTSILTSTTEDAAESLPIASQSAAASGSARGWLGVTIQALDKDTAGALGLDGYQGALVTGVAIDGPATVAGIKQGDVILSLDGHPIENSADLTQRFGAASAGQTLDMTVFSDGSVRAVSVHLAARPSESDSSPAQTPVTQPAYTERWMALVFLSPQYGSVAVWGGASNASSRQEALDAAMRQCAERGVGALSAEEFQRAECRGLATSTGCIALSFAPAGLLRTFGAGVSTAPTLDAAEASATRTCNARNCRVVTHYCAEDQ